MKIAVWRTAHDIANTVARYFWDGLCEHGHEAYMVHTPAIDPTMAQYIHTCDVHIGYGILRGMGDVMKECERLNKPFFHVDRGYLNPGHYDGYYRISYRGTQARWHEGIPRKPEDIKLEPRRTSGEFVLICPPTKPVCEFFDVHAEDWLDWARAEASKTGLMWAVRHKGEQWTIPWDNIRAVITFNSSVGWKALQMGIPVLSDVDHSLIGSFYKAESLDLLLENFHASEDNRLQIFETMAAHQFTLAEIKAGKAWGLIKHYLSISDGIQGSPSQQASVNTPLENGQNSRFRYIT